jgi:hypothetical protein
MLVARIVNTAMGDRERHRGAHPDDARLFAPSELPRLRVAAEEVAWLVGRGYPKEVAVKAVGGHHQLATRQRLALSRAVCSEKERRDRLARALRPDQIAGLALDVDGWNLLITLEVALSGGPLFVGMDGALRDLAGLRGSWHPFAETDAALALTGAHLAQLHPASARFLFDAPVSNSGRVSARLRDAARGWPFPVTAELVPNPDPLLDGNVVTADAAVLDRCPRWANLARWIIEARVPSAWLVELT